MKNLNYIKLGNTEPLLFLHGFNVSPNNHINFLEKLGEKYEVIVPDYTTCNPRCFGIDEYVERTVVFLHENKINDYKCIGYSLGGGIMFKLSNIGYEAPYKLLGINPLLPVNYGMLGFIMRGLKLIKKETITTTPDKIISNIKLLDSIMQSYSSSPLSCLATMYDLSTFQMSKDKILQPTRIIKNENDEFFNKNTIDVNLANHFENFDVINLPFANHNIRNNEKLILKYSLEFLDKNDR